MTKSIWRTAVLGGVLTILKKNTLWLLQQKRPAFQSAVPTLLQNQYSTAPLNKHSSSSRQYESSTVCQTFVRCVFYAFKVYSAFSFLSISSFLVLMDVMLGQKHSEKIQDCGPALTRNSKDQAVNLRKVKRVVICCSWWLCTKRCYIWTTSSFQGT